MPAIRLPSVCCAARPTTTAVIAPPTASCAASSPAKRSATQPRHDQEREPDQEADRPGRRRVHPPEQRGAVKRPEVARERPAEHRPSRSPRRSGPACPRPKIRSRSHVGEEHQREQRHDHEQLPLRPPGALGGLQRQGARTRRRPGGGAHARHRGMQHVQRLPGFSRVTASTQALRTAVLRGRSRGGAGMRAAGARRPPRWRNARRRAGCAPTAPRRRARSRRARRPAT